MLADLLEEDEMASSLPDINCPLRAGPITASRLRIRTLYAERAGNKVRSPREQRPDSPARDYPVPAART
jgi:hypothetical protein